MPCASVIVRGPCPRGVCRHGGKARGIQALIRRAPGLYGSGERALQRAALRFRGAA